MELRKIGNVSVDSAQIIICDPCYVEYGLDYKAICEEDGQHLLSGIMGTGVKISTPNGDGVFPVYVETDDMGKPRKLIVDLSPE